MLETCEFEELANQWQAAYHISNEDPSSVGPLYEAEAQFVLNAGLAELHSQELGGGWEESRDEVNLSSLMEKKLA